VVKNLLRDSGLASVLRQILESEPRYTDSPWHILARQHLGDAPYKKILYDLDAKRHGRVAEPAPPYSVAPESLAKMKQRKLFE